MNRLYDLFKSFFSELPKDGSRAKHLVDLLRSAFFTFLRLFSAPGKFPEARLFLPPSSLNVLKGLGKPVGILPIFSSSSSFHNEVTLFVCRVIWEIYGLPVRLMRARKPYQELMDPGQPDCINGDQIFSNLDWTEDLVDVDRVIMITDLPLITKDFPNLYGYAGLQIPIGIVSTHLMEFEKKRIIAWSRLIKTVVHEIAHTFSLPHCAEKTCIMSSREPLEKVSYEFCARCNGRLMATIQLVKSNEEDTSPSALPIRPWTGSKDS